MKVNFKHAIMAVAALTLGLISCSNDNDGVTGEQYVSVKIPVMNQPQTRALEDAGKVAAGTIKLKNGHIFVLDAIGNVLHNETLNVSQATSTGQVLSSTVSTNSRIFVIANIPTSDVSTVSGLRSLSAINAATSLMTTQSDYTEAALANVNNVPASITPGADNTASANVSINPLISRLELTQVKASGDITAFDVTGVYIDDYYPSFTYGGLYSGDIVSQGTSTTFNGIGDVGTWAASGLIAAPASNKVWAHNVASGGLPRFIIRIENVKWNPGLSSGGGSGEVPLVGTYYLTVTGYNNGNLTTFERGKIYRIGAVNGIEFDQDDLGLAPNPVDVTFTMNVLIEEWVLETPTADFK